MREVRNDAGPEDRKPAPAGCAGEKGWTQRQVAEQLGVSAQAVSKWERELGCPDVGLLPHLAEIFGVSVEGLLERRPD